MNSSRDMNGFGETNGFDEANAFSEDNPFGEANALEIENLTKNYTGFRLDHVNLVLPSGCIMGLVGENGAGKSTTIKLILNMIRRDEGTIRILGMENDKHIKLLKEDIGVVMDEPGIPECLTAKQVGNVMKHTFKHWQEEEYAALVRKLSLPDDKPFSKYSRGMKMKLGIAIAMSHRAKLLLLDEPTSGLDPVVRDDVVTMLNDFTRDENHSVLFSSHIVSDLEKLCDYIAFLHNGRLLLCEEKDRLLAKYGLLQCTAQYLKTLPPGAVLYKKESPYGTKALVLREAVHDTENLTSISIEELFVYLAKEAA